MAVFFSAGTWVIAVLYGVQGTAVRYGRLPGNGGCMRWFRRSSGRLPNAAIGSVSG